MAKPTIKTHIPRKAVSGSPKSKAEKAVKRYEDELRTLLCMRTSWDEKYPEASRELQELLLQQDKVQDCISAAHSAVAAAKETVGEFVCKRAFSSAGYDDQALVRVLARLEEADRASVVNAFLDQGVIKKIVLEKASVGMVAQDPDLGNKIKDAWRDRSELTPRVTTPKL